MDTTQQQRQHGRMYYDHDEIRAIKFNCLTTESRAFLMAKTYQILTVHQKSAIEGISKLARRHGWFAVTWKGHGCWYAMKIKLNNKRCPHCKKSLAARTTI